MEKKVGFWGSLFGSKRKEIAVEVCDISGLLPNQYCESKHTNVFEEGNEPTIYCEICKIERPNINIIITTQKGEVIDKVAQGEKLIITAQIEGRKITEKDVYIKWLIEDSQTKTRYLSGGSGYFNGDKPIQRLDTILFPLIPKGQEKKLNIYLTVIDPKTKTLIAHEEKSCTIISTPEIIESLLPQKLVGLSLEDVDKFLCKAITSFWALYKQDYEGAMKQLLREMEKLQPSAEFRGSPHIYDQDEMGNRRDPKYGLEPSNYFNAWLFWQASPGETTLLLPTAERFFRGGAAILREFFTGVGDFRLQPIFIRAHRACRLYLVSPGTNYFRLNSAEDKGKLEIKKDYS